MKNVRYKLIYVVYVPNFIKKSIYIFIQINIQTIHTIQHALRNID